MAKFYKYQGPYRNMVTGEPSATCPNCRRYVSTPTLCTVTHTVTRFYLFFPYKDQVERDGFKWTCRCGTVFITPTLDPATVYVR